MRPSPKQVGHMGAGWPRGGGGPHDKTSFFSKTSVELRRALLPKNSAAGSRTQRTRQRRSVGGACSSTSMALDRHGEVSFQEHDM